MDGWGATISATDHICHSKTTSAAAKKPYRPHGKSISAKSISATKISATKYTASLFGVIVTIRLGFVYSPYGEFERERSLYVSPSTAKMNVGFF